MKVKEVMTHGVKTCTREMNLAQVVEMMWTNNIGILPVVDTDKKIIGVLTDRDVCIATGTRPLLASQITAGSVMTGLLFVCKPEDDVRQALDIMRSQRVRRVPVVDESFVIQGLLSIDDIAIAAQEGADKAKVTFDDVARTLKGISEHNLPVRTVAATR